MVEENILKEVEKAFDEVENRNSSLESYFYYIESNFDVFLEDWKCDSGDFFDELVDDREKLYKKFLKKPAGLDTKTFNQILHKDTVAEIKKEQENDRNFFYKFLYASTIALLWSNTEGLLEKLAKIISPSWYSFYGKLRGKAPKTVIALQFLENNGLHLGKSKIFLKNLTKYDLLEIVLYIPLVQKWQKNCCASGHKIDKE